MTMPRALLGVTLVVAAALAALVTRSTDRRPSAAEGVAASSSAAAGYVLTDAAPISTDEFLWTSMPSATPPVGDCRPFIYYTGVIYYTGPPAPETGD
jgi:hypothetical protein